VPIRAQRKKIGVLQKRGNCRGDTQLGVKGPQERGGERKGPKSKPKEKPIKKERSSQGREKT